MEKFRWFLEKSGIDFKQHQYDGVAWCIQNETNPKPIHKIRGGFIADDMGLGKTITMIATFILHYLPQTLIILPNILVEQWRTEILRTTGHKVLIYHGTAKKNITLLQLQQAHIVIATYGAITIPKKKLTPDLKREDLSLLHQVEWGRVVFDEGHHLRNKNGRYFGAYALKAKVRWIVTGTPIQNRIKDFYNLCTVLHMPQSYYADKDNMRNLIDTFVLKRTKAQAGITLPPITPQQETVAWKSDTERELSKDIHNAINATRAKLKLMIHARQACILPSLLQTYIAKLVQTEAIPKIHTQFAPELSSSSKMDAVLDTLIARKDNGHGKIVFCHYRKEIDTVIERLTTAGVSNVCAFDGRLSQVSRIQKLKEAFSVIVLQIQTGCEGLNLQHNFSEVYFVSPHWNPAVEDQAVARCHRIGQVKPVSVFRFQMDQFETPTKPILTLDHYITSIQQTKRDVAKTILE